MINCDEFMAELGDYLEGQVAMDVRQQLELHLSQCRTCQVVVDSARKTVKIVTESGSFELPQKASERIVEGVMAKLRCNRDQPTSKKSCV